MPYRGPEKHHKIAVIGAGPAGIHMASLLKKRGYADVTVLERSGRIGGKSYTRVEDGVPYEMGTSFLHNGYRRIKDLVRSYGLRKDVPTAGRAVFLDGYLDQSSVLDYATYFKQVIANEWVRKNPRWNLIPSGLGTLKYFLDLWKYCLLYRSLFGALRVPYDIPFNLSSENLKKIDMSALEFLRINQLESLIGMFRVTQAAQGYGYLETIPVYYLLCWMTPQFVAGFVRQTIGFPWVTRMLPDGFETLWRTIAHKDALSIKLDTEIHAIDRQGPGGKVLIDYVVAKGERQVEAFDFLILTINLRDALGLLKDPTDVEQRLFGALEGFTLTMTLYESEAIPGYSTAADDKALGYFPNALGPGHDNEWYADRNDAAVVAGAIGARQRFDRQLRVAGQFSDQEMAGSPPIGGFRRDAAIMAKLEAEWAERGVQNPRVLEQCSWPYFYHFPGWAIQEGYTNELFAYQGSHRTWYAGASACFESVNHVVNYNHALVDTYLD